MAVDLREEFEDADMMLDDSDEDNDNEREEGAVLDEGGENGDWDDDDDLDI